MKRTTTVTLPDGTVAKRSSQSATYTHAVVVGPGTPEDRANSYARQALDCLDEAAGLRKAAAEAELIRQFRGYKREEDTVNSYDYKLVGTVKQGSKGHTYHTISERGTSAGIGQRSRKYLRPGDVVVEGNAADLGGFGPEHDYVLVDVRAEVIATALQEADRLEKVAQELHEKRTAALRGEGLGSYGVVRWSSREELALKAALGEYSGFRAQGHSVTVVPVD